MIETILITTITSLITILLTRSRYYKMGFRDAIEKIIEEMEKRESKGEKEWDKD